MTRAGWHLAGLPRADIARPYRWSPSTGYVSAGLYGYPDYPDGALRTTAPQLARHLAMVMNGGTFRSTRLLSAGSVRELRRDQVPELEPGQGLIWFRLRATAGPCSGTTAGTTGSRPCASSIRTRRSAWSRSPTATGARSGATGRSTGSWTGCSTRRRGSAERIRRTSALRAQRHQELAVRVVQREDVALDRERGGLLERGEERGLLRVEMGSHAIFVLATGSNRIASSSVS